MSSAPSHFAEGRKELAKAQRELEERLSKMSRAKNMLNLAKTAREWLRPLQSIAEILDLAKRGTARVQSLSIRASRYEYVISCYCAPIDPWYEPLVDLGNVDDLLIGLRKATRRIETTLLQEKYDGIRPVSDVRWGLSTFSLDGFGRGADFARCALVGVRMSQGLICQTYRDGWPQVAPFVALPDPPGLGLVLAAAFSEERCSEIPFSETSIREVLNDVKDVSVSFEWHDDENLLPNCCNCLDLCNPWGQVAGWI